MQYQHKITEFTRLSTKVDTYVASLWNHWCYLMTVMMMMVMMMMKPADGDCPTTCESPHLGLSTLILFSLLPPASAPLSLGYCTGQPQNIHYYCYYCSIDAAAAAAVTITSTVKNHKLQVYRTITYSRDSSIIIDGNV